MAKQTLQVDDTITPALPIGTCADGLYLKRVGNEFIGVSPPDAFPVGSVFIAVVSTNPATLLGFGTWVAFGAGRVMVGINASDTDFDIIEEIGGEKSHILSPDEVP